LYSQPPKLFTITVDDVVLVGMGVNFPSAGGGVKEVGKEGDIHSIMIVQETRRMGVGDRLGRMAGED
jgi:hypothetical protein